MTALRDQPHQPDLLQVPQVVSEALAGLLRTPRQEYRSRVGVADDLDERELGVLLTEIVVKTADAVKD